MPTGKHLTLKNMASRISVIKLPETRNEIEHTQKKYVRLDVLLNVISDAMSGVISYYI